MISAGRKLVQHVLPGIIKPLRVLWNEMIGFVFLVFAIVSAPKLWQSYQDFAEGKEAAGGRVLLTGAFFLTMLLFGVTSFWKAKKISRT